MSDFNINFRVEGAEEGAEEIKQLTGETEKLSKTQEKTTKKVQSYKSQIKDLRLELVKLGDRTKENAEQYDNLSAQIRKLDDAQEDLVIGTGQLDDQLAALPGPIGRASQQFKIFDIALKNVKGAKVQLIKQFPILKNAIAATGIGALVIIFGLLVAAVIKAFNSFKPLQDAVGRLGIAFDLVFKLVEPLIELIGKGLVVAIDAAAKGIAFLTGNMEEYNKQVRAAEATRNLTTELERLQYQMEMNGDTMTQLQKDLLQSEINYLERIKELNETEGLSDEEKARRKTDILRRYSREQLAANNAERDRQQTALREEQQRQKERNKLTDEQIAKIKEIQQAAIDAQIEILKARDIGTFEGVDAIKRLNEQLDFLKGLTERAETPLEKLQKILKNLGETRDEGGEILRRELQNLRSFFDESSKVGITQERALQLFKQNSDQVLKTIQENKDKFLGEDVSVLFRNLIRDYENLIVIFKDSRIKNQQEIIDALQELDEAKNEGDFLREKKALNNLDVLRQQFITDYSKQLQKQARDQGKILDPKQAEDNAKRFFEAIRENLGAISEFTTGVDKVERKITELNDKIVQAKEKGISDLFVIENEDLILNSLENFLVGGTEKYRTEVSQISSQIDEVVNKMNELRETEFMPDVPDEFIELNKKMKELTDKMTLLSNTSLENIVKDAGNLKREIDELEDKQIELFPTDPDGMKARQTFIILREQIRITQKELDELFLVPEKDRDYRAIGKLTTQISGLEMKLKKVGEVSLFSDEQKKQLEESKKAYQQQVQNLTTLLSFFNKDLVVSQQTAEKLLSGLVQRKGAVDDILNQMNIDFFANRLEQDLAALEKQKQIDLELLRSKQATAQQIADLEDMYRRRRERLEGQTNVAILEGTAQTLSLIGDLFEEHTGAFKALKYFEALISALVAGQKAFEWAWENTGKAAPILAPLLGSLTTAKGIMTANKILQTPEPSTPDYKELGGEVFGPRHSQGGVMLNAEGGEFVINRRAMMNPFVSMMAPMLNQMNENSQPPIQPNPPIKTYVLTGDLISQEKADKRIQDLARF